MKKILLGLAIALFATDRKCRAQEVGGRLLADRLRERVEDR